MFSFKWVLDTQKIPRVEKVTPIHLGSIQGGPKSVKIPPRPPKPFPKIFQNATKKDAKITHIWRKRPI